MIRLPTRSTALVAVFAFVAASSCSPVGPLRVDGAVTLNPEQGDDYWAVHVLLGQPF